MSVPAGAVRGASRRPEHRIIQYCFSFKNRLTKRGTTFFCIIANVKKKNFCDY